MPIVWLKHVHKRYMYPVYKAIQEPATYVAIVDILDTQTYSV